MNDGLRTDVFVRYPPETIAVACIYLSARKLLIPLPKSPSWFDVLGVEEDDIKECCYKMICLYNRKKPVQDELEAVVDNLRQKMEEKRKRGSGSGAGSRADQNNSDSQVGGGVGSNNATPPSDGRSPAAKPERSPAPGNKKRQDFLTVFINFFRNCNICRTKSTLISSSGIKPIAAEQRAKAWVFNFSQ